MHHVATDADLLLCKKLHRVGGTRTILAKACQLRAKPCLYAPRTIISSRYQSPCSLAAVHQCDESVDRVPSLRNLKSDFRLGPTAERKESTASKGLPGVAIQRCRTGPMSYMVSAFSYASAVGKETAMPIERLVLIVVPFRHPLQRVFPQDRIHRTSFNYRHSRSSWRSYSRSEDLSHG